ncbi:MAG: hypothetical protein FWE84_02155 [Firmicutes bacterium]|nr:hypothetical protein [Bacillota bacterium]
MNKIINTDNVKKFIKNEAGICPICGSAELEISSMSPEDNSVYYDWFCDKCEACGKEWYDVTFSTHGHVVKENGEEVKNDEGY